MEMITVLDENGNIIGSLDRAEAGAKGAIRSIAGVIVFNSKGNIILQRISENKNHCPLKLSYSAAGHVDAEESTEAAAIRELKEELGIDAELKSYIGRTKAINPDGTINSFHHIFKAVHDGPYTADPEEVEELLELTPQELINLVRNHPDEFEWGIADILSMIGIK